jgi:hypothetical protein
MVTGYKDQNGVDLYFWGFSKKGSKFKASITDKNQSAVWP